MAFGFEILDLTSLSIRYLRFGLLNTLSCGEVFDAHSKA